MLNSAEDFFKLILLTLPSYLDLGQQLISFKTYSMPMLQRPQQDVSVCTAYYAVLKTRGVESR